MFWRAVRVRSNKAARKPHSLRAALEIIHPLLIPTLKARLRHKLHLTPAVLHLNGRNHLQTSEITEALTNK